MKKTICFVFALTFVLLAGCGKQETATEPDAQSTTAAVESTTDEPVSWDDGDFLYGKGDLPKGWTRSADHSTSTYLEAYYGKGENAPKLTVSTFVYSDTMGADKTRLLADAVKERESKTASEITKLKIGGMDFYALNYDSLVTEKTRCYVFFGQTVPDKNKEYHFVEIQLDNVKDAKQYESLKGVLDTLNFKF